MTSSIGQKVKVGGKPGRLALTRSWKVEKPRQ